MAGKVIHTSLCFPRIVELTIPRIAAAGAAKRGPTTNDLHSYRLQSQSVLCTWFASYVGVPVVTSRRAEMRPHDHVALAPMKE